MAKNKPSNLSSDRKDHHLSLCSLQKQGWSQVYEYRTRSGSHHHNFLVNKIFLENAFDAVMHFVTVAYVGVMQRKCSYKLPQIHQRGFLWRQQSQISWAFRLEKEKNVRAWLCQSEADYQDKLLACGAIIVAQLRVRVLEETQFTCSAGIAHNKMLAKLVSGMHKPAQQTVVPSSSVQDLLASLPVKKMKQLGGKLGSSLQDDLGVETIGDLLSFTEEKLQEQYGVNTG
ncbi:DNA polymerase eta [Zea mays]|uniref:DNA polymerase eta n=1 Tax=Zea mays TaxID=4577 RepID=A0A1D6IV17_MAIZE|nr:DNA polymerase eta [Zea mays]